MLNVFLKFGSVQLRFLERTRMINTVRVGRKFRQCVAHQEESALGTDHNDC